MNARFWIGYNGHYTKLTLKPGQRVHFGHGGPTDEGWHFYGEEIEFDGENVFRYCTSDGRDCDGRLSSYTDLVCPLVDLAAYPGYEDDEVMVPAWQDVRSWQRDYAAEAMGY